MARTAGRVLRRDPSISREAVRSPPVSRSGKGIDVTFATPPSPTGGWRALRPGTRVVVRRRLAPTGPVVSDGGSAHRWTDLIGFVVEVSDAGLRLRTDPVPGRGEPEEVTVAAADIAAAKPVPPRPVRRSGPPR